VWGDSIPENIAIFTGYSAYLCLGNFMSTFKFRQNSKQTFVSLNSFLRSEILAFLEYNNYMDEFIFI
jgi:hypothetical protein